MSDVFAGNLWTRGKPVEALKTALEGSPPNTRDERCKVRFSLFLALSSESSSGIPNLSKTKKVCSE